MSEGGSEGGSRREGVSVCTGMVSLSCYDGFVHL